MPIDYRRINPPEGTLPYELFSKKNNTIQKQKLISSLKEGNKRSDSRTNEEFRKIFLKTGVVSQAKGSAYIEMGKTKVIVSVYDLHEIPNKIDYCLKGEIYCEFKFAPFSCPKRLLHQQNSEEKMFSTLMKQALEPAICRHEFPNFQVDIYALVLHNDGSALSAAITAAGLAVAHAGLPMFDIITAATITIDEDLKLVDPTLEEESLIDAESNINCGIIVLSILNTHQQISQMYQCGSLNYKNIEEALTILKNSSKYVVHLIEKALVKHVDKISVNEN